VNENYLAVAAALELTADDIYKLVRNSFDASFLSTKEKKDYIALLETKYRSFK